MINKFLLIIHICFWQMCMINYVNSQTIIAVPNKSLEDTITVNNFNKAPISWTICAPTPNVIVNKYGGGGLILPNPSHGIYYAALEGITSINIHEQIGTKLGSSMKSNRTYYLFLDLREILSMSQQDGILDIYGGTTQCNTSYHLWTSPSLDSSKWTRFKAILHTPVNIEYIVLSGRNEIDSNVNQGAVLIDNLSDIYDSATYVGMSEAEIKASTAAEQLSIYPNPAATMLQCQSATMLIDQIEIYDIMGRQLINEKMRKLVNETNIDVSKLPSGIYYIKAIAKNGEYKTGKFLKE